MGVLVMMLDLVDVMGSSDLNNNILPFRWPQHSFLIEHFRDNKPTLSTELQNHLEGLEIFAEEQTTKNIDGKISSAARKCGLLARKRSGLLLTSFSRGIAQDSSQIRRRDFRRGKGSGEERGRTRRGRAKMKRSLKTMTQTMRLPKMTSSVAR